MSDNRYKRLAIAAGLAAALSACAGSGTQKFSTPYQDYNLSTPVQLDTRQKATLMEAIIAADMAAQQDDHLTAMSNYLFAADLSKEPELIQKSIESARLAKDPLGLEQAAQIWLKGEPKSIQAQTLLLQAQLGMQDAPAALVTARRLMTLLDSSQSRYQVLEKHLLKQDPRLTFNLLHSLSKALPQEAAIETVFAQFLMSVADTPEKTLKMSKQALIRVEAALKIKADFIPAVRVKSHIYFQIKQDDQARQYLSDTFARHPQTAAYSHMLGQLLYDLRDFAASEAHFEDWLLSQPNDAEALYYLSASQYAQEDFSAAIIGFKQLIQMDYQTQSSAYYCGDAALKSQQLELAIECFSQVEPGRYWTTAQLQVAAIYRNQKQYQESLLTLATASQTQDLSAGDKAKLSLAEIDILFRFISPADAQVRLENALAEMPNNRGLLLKQIEVFKLAEKPKQLLKLLEETKELFPSGEKRDDFNLAAATLLSDNGHTQLAIDWIEEALKAKPDDKDLLYTRAIYKEPLGQVKQMLAEFKQLHALYPDDLTIQNALGYTMVDQGVELELAANLIEAALKGLPDNPAVMDSKGWLLFRQGDLKAAAIMLSQAFKLSPSADIAAHLGEVLWRQGDKPQAMAVWRQGQKINPQAGVLVKTLERLNVEL